MAGIASPDDACTTTTLADIDRQALDWFVRRDQGLTPREQHAFDDWLGADARHTAALVRWQRDWRRLDALAPNAGIDQLRQRLAEHEAATASAAGPPRRRQRRQLARITIGLGLLGALIAGLQLW